MSDRNQTKERLTAAMIAQMKENDVEWEVFLNIFNNMQGDERDEREIVKTMTAGQRAIYVSRRIQSEVDNGGFNQFYFNSTGELADMGEEAFRTLGSDKLADLMVQVNKKYDEIKDYLQQYNDGLADSFSASYRGNPLNEFDKIFRKLYQEEGLNTLRNKYIHGHLSEFVTE